MVYQLLGSEGAVKSLDEAKSICKEIGYPFLLKLQEVEEEKE